MIYRDINIQHTGGIIIRGGRWQQSHASFLLGYFRSSSLHRASRCSDVQSCGLNTSSLHISTLQPSVLMISKLIFFISTGLSGIFCKCIEYILQVYWKFGISIITVKCFLWRSMQVSRITFAQGHFIPLFGTKNNYVFSVALQL